MPESVRLSSNISIYIRRIFLFKCQIRHHNSLLHVQIGLSPRILKSYINRFIILIFPLALRVPSLSQREIILWNSFIFSFQNDIKFNIATKILPTYTSPLNDPTEMQRVHYDTQHKFFFQHNYRRIPWKT